jgi:23S rRNA maturation-related 3'-5' exoribonuclease YhaM
MPDKVIYPINIVAKNEANSSIYDIAEYVQYNGKTTMTLTVRGDDIGEIAINATKAIHAMEEAIIKRDKENKTTTEDVLTEEVSLFNAKQEEADGR